jgi:hypothetical protein
MTLVTLDDEAIHRSINGPASLRNTFARMRRLMIGSGPCSMIRLSLLPRAVACVPLTETMPVDTPAFILCLTHASHQ